MGPSSASKKETSMGNTSHLFSRLVDLFVSRYGKDTFAIIHKSWCPRVMGTPKNVRRVGTTNLNWTTSEQYPYKHQHATYMCKSVYPSYIYPFFFVDLEINHPQASNCSLNSNALTKKWKTIHGCFLKWWYPQNTPKWSFFLGKPMVVGYHHLNGGIPKTPQNDHFS